MNANRREFLAASAAVLLTAGRRRSAATIPIELNHNRPFVPVELSGTGHRMREVSCWFDTGGGAFVVTKPVADALGLAPSGPVQGTEGAHFQAVSPPRLFVGTQEIVLAGSATMMSLDGPTIDASVGAPGFLPGHVLREHRVLLDYPGKRFGLDLPAETTTALSVQIDPHTSFPRIEVGIEGERVGLLLDTGASCTMLSRAFIDRLAAKHPDWKTVQGAYGSANMRGRSGELEARMIRIPAIDLGGMTLRDVVAVSRPPDTFEHWMSKMVPAPIVGALGGNALRNLRLQIDYVKNAASAALSENPVPHEFEMVPLILQPTFKGYQIAGTLAGAKFSQPAAALAGKTLVAIDDEAVEGKPLGSVIAKLRGDAGSTRRLKVQSGSGTTTVDATIVKIL